MKVASDVSTLAEAVLLRVVKERRVEIRDICDTFNVTKETATSVIDFLVGFGFLRNDKKKKYLTLSEASREFFK